CAETARGNLSFSFRARSIAVSKSSTPIPLAMNPLPCLAKHHHVIAEFFLNAPEFAPREAVVLPKFHRPYRTVQIENRLAPPPNYMHMCRPVVVRIQDHTEPAKSQDGRHQNILAYFPSDWVIS